MWNRNNLALARLYNFLLFIFVTALFASGKITWWYWGLWSLFFAFVAYRLYICT